MSASAPEHADGLRSVSHQLGHDSLQMKELSMSDDQSTDVVAALSDGAYTLFVADFADTDTALVSAAPAS